MLDAIDKAQHLVLIADWSFHPMFRPTRAGTATAADPSNSIGALLLQKASANPQVLIAVHTWNHTVKVAPRTK